MLKLHLEGQKQLLCCCP